MLDSPRWTEATPQKQSKATEEVSSYLEAVAALAHQTAAGASTSAKATDGLARCAQDMRRALGRIKIRVTR